MKTFKTLGLAILLTSTTSIAMAQGMDHSNMDGMSMDGMSMDADANESSDLPEICLENADHMAGMSMDMGAMMEGMSEGHQAMMADMGAMHSDMMAAMMAEDFDVAFICGMIPHHQGALAMANAALEYSEDEWVKELAEEIVDAQEREIAEMLEWLDAR
ncbi:MAG TPA: DUF305 domain-containing protein [Pelagibacterium sp.]|nr:DUF305 domain-containing protein [Pelagibacterium sp.]|tara:strand:+ start:7200 stop:7676 length:477 start_codon:yes stop_codon:yes gene_type:complete